jgi:hypothetical protein
MAGEELGEVIEMLTEYIYLANSIYEKLNQ